MEKKEKRMLQIRVDKEVKDAIDELAKKEGRSTSNYVACWLENYLLKQNKKD